MYRVPENTFREECLLIFTVVKKDNRFWKNELFGSAISDARFISLMGEERFEFLVKCLRMDDKTLRPLLRLNNAFLLTKNIWELFIKECGMNYAPELKRQLMNSCSGLEEGGKPNKYEIKFQWYVTQSPNAPFNDS